MTDIGYIFWTTGSIDEARKVGRFLVQEGLVACVNIVPWVESIFKWNQQIQTEQETQVILKTLTQNFDKVAQVIKENTTYEVPAITMVKAEQVNSSFSQYIHDAIDPKASLHN